MDENNASLIDNMDQQEFKEQAKDKKITLQKQWELVVKAYEKQGLFEHDALQQARVARILRHGDYNMSTGEVKQWQI